MGGGTEILQMYDLQQKALILFAFIYLALVLLFIGTNL